MRKYALAALGITAAAVAAVLVGPNLAGKGTASSHREAPLIAEDPTGDNTDLYAFRSPDKPNTLTIVSNWIPGEDPAAGPNWYTFSPSARYNIKIDRTGDGRADLTYAFRFKTATGPLFLGNTTQSFSVMRNGRAFAKGTTPPNNIGPRLLGFLGVKNYNATVAKSIVSAPGGVKVFAGQRDDAFFGDIGAIFDLLAFRKAGTTGNKGGGKDFFAGYNVHSVALQIPIGQLDNARHTIGIWSSTDRRNVTVGGKLNRGWTQVSRLGNPLINEVIIPTSLKDAWNRGRAGPGREVPEVLHRPAARSDDQHRLQAGRPRDEAGRPGGGAADRHPQRHVHGRKACGHAADQPRRPGDTGRQGQPHGRARRRQPGLAERAPAQR